MKEVTFENNRFLIYEVEDASFVFSTAENALDFNKALPQGRKNLGRLRDWFELEEIGYCNQIHTDVVNIFSGNVKDGDAIITDKKNVGVGVFTADCVPILLYDKSNRVVAAVHSGWRGTVKAVVMKCIEKMGIEYDSKPEDIVAYIGPHNRSCCYEVGQEVLAKFEIKYANGGNLNLTACISEQLKCCGVNESNIKDIELCTYCATNFKLHSYRKTSEGYGRMFSFVFIKI